MVRWVHLGPLIFGNSQTEFRDPAPRVGGSGVHWQVVVGLNTLRKTKTFTKGPALQSEALYGDPCYIAI